MGLNLPSVCFYIEYVLKVFVLLELFVSLWTLEAEIKLEKVALEVEVELKVLKGSILELNMGVWAEPSRLSPSVSSYYV